MAGVFAALSAAHCEDVDAETGSTHSFVYKL